MSTLRAIRVRNLRCIEDSGWVELKPLTLLVGANSSGKSSLLRLFPLLKQSVRTATRGPLLWYDNLVDFGSYRDAVRGHDEGREIAIEYRMELRRPLERLEPPEARRRGSTSPIDLTISTLLGFADEGGTRHRECEIICSDLRDRFSIDENGAVVFYRSETPFSRRTRLARADQPIPLIEPLHSGSGLFKSDPIGAEFARVLANYVSEDELEEVFYSSRRLEFDSVENLATQLEHILFWHPLRSKGAKDSERRIDPSKLVHLQRLLFQRDTDALLAEANAAIGQFANGTAYVRPFRADPLRFYRRTDLAVDVVDPTGDNLAMFIRSLSESAQKRLEEWTKHYFGFHVKASPSGSQIELRVVTQGGEEQNLVDMGYGYSQVLPVLVQLWLASHESDRSRKRRRTTVPVSAICIEQPELHLHPAMQRQLAETLAGVVAVGRKVPSDLRIPMFIETHSQSVITGIGDAVARGQVRPDEVQILLFDKLPSKDAQIRRVGFDEEGSLTGDWPIGFLEP